MQGFYVLLLAAVFLINGCAYITTVTPELDRQTQAAQAGQYLQALPQDIKGLSVLYKANTKSGAITIEDIKTKPVDMMEAYANNYKSGGQVIDECIKIEKNKSGGLSYAPCLLLDQQKDLLSGYYSANYTPITGVLNTFIGLPLYLGVQIVFGVPLSILAWDTKSFEAIPRYIEKVPDSWSKRQLDTEKVNTLGTAVDKMLTVKLNSQFSAALQDKLPEPSVTFMNTFPNYFKNHELTDSLLGKYRERAQKTSNAQDYAQAYKLSKDQQDIRNAAVCAKSDEDNVVIEGALVSCFPNKHQLVRVVVNGADNFKGAAAGEAANLFIVNLGAKGIDDAKIDVKVVASEASIGSGASAESRKKFKFRYADYQVKVKLKLKLFHKTSGLIGSQVLESNVQREESFILRKNSGWSEEKSVSFGEIVQSAGSALFGLKIMDIRLVKTELIPEIIDVTPL